MLKDELKMPSDLEDEDYDDEEEGEEEGLFPEDKEGSFPIDDEYDLQPKQRKAKGKKVESESDEEG